MKKYAQIICYLLLSISFTNAQVPYELLQKESLQDTSKRTLSMEWYSHNYFLNYEYFNDIATGYTLFGTQNILNFSYQHYQNITAKAGAYLKKDFGNESLMVKPYYLLSLHKNGYELNFGNYEGNVAHRLLAPMYNIDNIIHRNLENGIQFKIDKRKIWSDTWIDWQKQEYMFSNFKERLQFGHSTQVPIKLKPNHALTGILQATIQHQGGQIDTSNLATYTIANAAIGLDYLYNLNSCVLKNIGLSVYGLGYKQLNGAYQYHFKNGNGFLGYINAYFVHNLSVNVGYWNGHQFIHPNGNYIYQSVALQPILNQSFEQKRNLLLLNINYLKKRLFGGVTLVASYQPYYDINNNIFESSYSLQFVFQPSFILKRY